MDNFEVQIQRELLDEVRRRREQLRADEALAAELAGKLKFDDKVETLLRRFPTLDREVLGALLSLYDGDVDKVANDISPPVPVRQVPAMKLIQEDSIPQAEDGSGLLIADCPVNFPSLNPGVGRSKTKQKRATGVASRQAPTYASTAATIVAADESNWMRLLNQYPHLNSDDLTTIFMASGRNMKETVRKIEEMEMKKRVDVEEVAEKETPATSEVSQYRNINADSARVEAVHHQQQSQYFCDLGKDPKLKHFPDLAQYYKVMMEAHAYQAQEENEKAARLIAAAMNKDKDPFTVDLHYLYGYEAEEYLAEWLAMQAQDLRRALREQQRTLKVVTGKGLHSRNRTSKLTPRVRKFLTQNGYSFELKDGYFYVTITAF